VRVWLLYDGPLKAELCKSPRVEVEVVPHRSFAGRAEWIRRRIRRESVRVLHAHGLAPEVLAGAASWGIPSCGLIATVHSDPGDVAWRAPGRGIPSALALWLARRTRASRLIAVTEDIALKLARSGLPRTRIVHVPNGVEAPASGDLDARSRIRSELGVSDRTFVIGIVGRLEPVKGHRRLIEALASLGDGPRPAEAWFVGDGPLRNELEKEVSRRDLSDRIRFLGFRGDVRSVMAALDVGVFCSDHEGMPYAALEMMASGVPLVARRVGGLAEIVADRNDGLLYPAGDPTALSGVLTRLRDDPALTSRLGSAASSRAAVDFAIERCTSRTREIWRQVAPPSDAGETPQTPAG
jgi:glycosyltransferase involved in cell wall biosynthesis